MASDNSVYENSKTAPPSTNIDGKNFDAGTPAQVTNDSLAEHGASQPSPTIINSATAESSQFSTARDGGGGQVGVPQSGARVVAHAVGSDTRGDD
jgi:hypothetical protein